MNKANHTKDNKRAEGLSGESGWRPHRPLGAAGGLSGNPDWQSDSLGIESLIREGAALKSEIDSKTARLRLIHLRFAESVRFENGKKTAHLVGAGYQVRVRLHDNIAWDQEKILKFREYVLEEKFGELFKAVYEPTSQKQIDGFIGHADRELSNGLKWCMSVKPGVPQVTYEKLS
jgi:hypothetical protein